MKKNTAPLAARFLEKHYERKLADCLEVAVRLRIPVITLIRNYRPIELYGLQEELREARREITSLKTDFLADKSWKDEFKQGLGEHNRQLGILIEGLKEEREARKEEDKSIRDKLDRMSGYFQGGRWVIGGILFLIGVAVTVIAEHFFR